MNSIKLAAICLAAVMVLSAMGMIVPQDGSFAAAADLEGESEAPDTHSETEVTDEDGSEDDGEEDSGAGESDDSESDEGGDSESGDEDEEGNDDGSEEGTDGEDSDGETDDDSDDGETDEEDDSEDGSEDKYEDVYDFEDIIDPQVTTTEINNEDGTVTLVKSATGLDEDGDTVTLEYRITEKAGGNVVIEEYRTEESPDGEKETESSITLSTPDGDFTTETETSVDRDGNVRTETEMEIEFESEDNVTPEQITKMLDDAKKMAAGMGQTTEEMQNVVSIIAGTDESVKLGPESFQAIGDEEAEFRMTTENGVLELDTDVCNSMSGMSGDITVTMKQDDASALNDAQKEAIGGNSFVTLNADTADGGIHELNGTATVILNDRSFAGKDVYYIDDQGNREKVDSQTVGSQLNFTTSHFSVYMIDDTAPAESGSGYTMIVAGAVALLAVIGAAVFLIRRNH